MRDGLHELRRIGLGGVLAALLAPIRELSCRVIIELAGELEWPPVLAREPRVTIPRNRDPSHLSSRR